MTSVRDLRAALDTAERERVDGYRAWISAISVPGTVPVEARKGLDRTPAEKALIEETWKRYREACRRVENIRQEIDVKSREERDRWVRNPRP